MSIFWKPQGEESKKAPIIIKKISKSTDEDKIQQNSLEKNNVKKKNALWSGTDSFFWGLGFKKTLIPATKPTLNKVQQQEQQEEDKKEKEIIANDEFFAQASQIAKKNAVVVRNADISHRNNNIRTITHQKKTPSIWWSWSNISFWQWQYKTKPQHGNNNNWGWYRGRPSYNNSPVVKKEPIVPKLKIIKEAAVSGTLTKKDSIIIKDVISVKEFSEKSGIPFPQILKHMLANKIVWGINTALDFDTVSLIALEFDVSVVKEQQGMSLDNVIMGDLNAIVTQDKEAEHTLPRAPIVTVMGHVDHGKTSLLDYIRKTSVAGGESGGITQSIWASKIIHNGNPITFIDTPGHELFTNLRSRGAKVTNIAIIVIAADDGLKPQTIESINHAKEAGVPIIIAITKIDKWEPKIEQIKSEIGNYGLIPEERGGNVPLIGVSSKTWEGIDKLLDQILFQSELLDLKYDPQRPAIGVIIDAQKDAKQGILTSLIVLTGTLKVGDIVVVHNTYGKIRKMINSHGIATRTATGWEPVQILGINHIPEPGRVVEVVANEKEAQKRIEIINESSEKNSVSTLGSFLEQMKKNEWAVLKIVCKSSGPSSLEAMNQALNNLPLPKNVSFKIIHSGIGDIVESDIWLAQAAEAIVLWFNVSCGGMIIYHLTDYIEQIMKDMVEKEYREVERGKLKILGVFFKKEKTMIIGGKVLEGKIGNGMKFRTENEDQNLVITGEITSLQRETNSVKEVAEWYECGMKVKVSKKVTEGEILTFYEMEEIIDNNL
jgi:translation initiation factor IF-2